MILRPVSSDDMGRARALYLDSFPEYERVPLDKLEAHLIRGDTGWLGIYEGGRLCGTAYVLFNERILFILYLAVDPSCRNNGYGSAALKAVMERHPYHKTFLNIEPPDEECDNSEQRLRRQGFYVRNGFIPSGRLHTSDGDFITMCYMGRITDEELNLFRLDVGLDILFDGGMELERSQSHLR